MLHQRLFPIQSLNDHLKMYILESLYVCPFDKSVHQNPNRVRERRTEHGGRRKREKYNEVRTER